ncbi:hypothetical protein PT974_08351 [Cladobotryum mycophilum]|uniref:Uncharacterized protein n=1 Tax=Cladobotryum mycophilum TaxID=491253 RepID=A0ABR0SD35_9HYPO
MAATLTEAPRRPASSPSSSSSKAVIATSSGISHGGKVNTNNGPHGHFIRRSKTIDETSAMRSGRPSPMARQFSSDSSSEAPARRSSNFSEYSLNEARDIINPKPSIHGVHGAEFSHQETSSLAQLSLAFALLPAVAGILFKNGSSFTTDVMLLVLAAIFLHWSVTQPWLWYHAAQEVRVREEANADLAVDDDSDVDSLAQSPTSTGPLEDVPEDEVTKTASPRSGARESQLSDRQQSAIKELYRYEVLALLSCFMFPLLSAYLLHAIRSQLSRPSEGLVSNYNLTIFLMASELRVFSHMIKLVHSRTLHLQRIVHESPYGPPAGTQLDALLGRLERLEAMSLKEHMLVEQGAAFDSTKASMTRDIRNTIQPELDALNRAVRRYEKKATLLQLQTEARFSDVNSRLDDAIALAAVAAKNTHRRKNIFSWTVESLTAILLLPVNAVLQILTFPLKPIVALISRKKQHPPPPRTSRGSRNGKAPMPVRYSGDRVPTRLMKR